MNTKQYLSILCSMIFIIILSLPTAQYEFNLIHEQPLSGYIRANNAKPNSMVSGWFNRQLQRYLEEQFGNQVGFKPSGIRAFNEVTFRLFSEQPHINLYFKKKYGLYSKMSIDYLNAEYSDREHLTQAYEDFSKKAANLQQQLAAKGIHFVIVIGSSKPYVHPEALGKKFLVHHDADLFSTMASLARELKKQGVHVIDSGSILREFYKTKLIETHPYSGVHWNYYAGCVIAKFLLKDVKKTFTDSPSLHCGKPVFKAPEMVDVDGLLLLNVLTKVNLAKPTPYPTPAISSTHYLPTILLIGDSFMDQIIYALNQARSYSKLTISSYFHTRWNIKPGKPLPGANPSELSTEQIQNSVIDDALRSDVIVLEMVDYNSNRLGYGFVEAMLGRLKEQL